MCGWKCARANWEALKVSNDKKTQAAVVETSSKTAIIAKKDKRMHWKKVWHEPSLLGESPFWHPHEQRLYWLDIAGKKIVRLQPATGAFDTWPLDQEPGCIAPAARGGWVLALRREIIRALVWGGPLTELASFTHDPLTTRFNDGKCDPCGRFWAGTVYEPKNQAQAALYSLDCRTAHTVLVERQWGGAFTSNGLAFSPDAATVYWADTPRHTVYAWDWDAQLNVLSGQRVFAQFASKPEGWRMGQPGYAGRPDGAAVDAEGNYYVAMYEGMRVLKLAPDGRLLDDIPTPTPCPTMVCFGGDDLRTLFLTSAWHQRPAHELQTYPDAGCVFSMRVDTPGLPVNFFVD